MAYGGGVMVKNTKGRVVITNGDRIRQMSNEEIVKFLGLADEENELRCPPGQRICAEDCQKCWLDWLNKECEK